MNNNIIKYEDYKKDLELLRELAHNAFKSGSYQASEVQLFNVMLSAKDLGVSPMKAINGGFNIINGKISMSTSLMADRIRKDGHSIKVVDWTIDKCVIIGQRKDNNDSVKVEFTSEDAKLAGLWGSNVWKKYPKAMLYNRAMSMLARVLFPDVVGNCYSEEEAEEIKKSDMSFKPVFRDVQTPTIESNENIVQLDVAEEPDISITEICHKLIKELDISDTENLEEYVQYCKDSLNVPLKKFSEKWTENPDRFVKCYDKWLEKNGKVKVNI